MNGTIWNGKDFITQIVRKKWKACLTHYSKSSTVHKFTPLVSRSVTLVFNELPRD